MYFLLDSFLWIIIITFFFHSVNENVLQERRVLLAWALHSRKWWLNATKKIKWGDAAVSQGWPKEVMVDLRPEWCLQLYNNTCLSECFRQRHKQEPRPWVGISLMCSRNRKKTGEQWRDRRAEVKPEMKSHNTSLTRSLDYILNIRKSYWRAWSREKRQKLVAFLKTIPIAKWGWLTVGWELESGDHLEAWSRVPSVEMERDQLEAEQEGLVIMSYTWEVKRREEQRMIPIIHTRSWMPFYWER